MPTSRVNAAAAKSNGQGLTAPPQRRSATPSKPKATKRAEQSLRTRERILDASESLFSRHGYHGVSLRQVAGRAKVDTALLHYYFKTKQGLFDATFARRASVINEERLASLADYEAACGDHPTVDGAIDAFLSPVLDWLAKGGPRWRDYFALIAQVSNNPEFGGVTMARYFDPVVHRLIDLVARALPDADPADLYWAYHMLSGSLMLTLSETGRIDRLSEGLCRSDDIETIKPRMIEFSAAGFRAVCRAR